MYKTDVPQAQLETFGFPVPINGEKLYFYWDHGAQMKLIMELRSGRYGDMSEMELSDFMDQYSVSVPIAVWAGLSHYKDFDLSPDQIGHELYEYFYNEAPEDEREQWRLPQIYMSKIGTSVIQAQMRSTKGFDNDPFGLTPKKSEKPKKKSKASKKE